MRVWIEFINLKMRSDGELCYKRCGISYPDDILLASQTESVVYKVSYIVTLFCFEY